MIARRVIGDRYQLGELLGEGGVGRVQAADDLLLGRKVAIKTLRPEASRNREFLGRFISEARSTADLRHPNIITLHDLIEGPPPCIVMELVEGHTLEQFLEWLRVLPQREALAIVHQAAAGLAAAHQREIVHRDIKPSNLMISNNGLLKIMDFGIARVRGSQRLTSQGQVYATLLYASPEQLLAREVDGRSDVYSLAAVVYEMLSGAPPFVAEFDDELVKAHLETPPAPLGSRVPGLDPRIETGVMRALAKNPGDRFETVEQFATAIGADAVRGHAAELLAEFFTPVLQRIYKAPAQSPAIASSGGASAAPLTELIDEKPARAHPAAGMFGVRKQRQWLRGPIAALAAVVIAFVAGIAYVAWPVEKPVEKKVVELKPAPVIEPPAASAPAPSAPEPAAAPEPTAKVEQPPAPPPPAPEPPKVAAIPPPPPPPGPQPAPKPVVAPASPSGTADTKEDVRKTQLALKHVGCYFGAIDGVSGPAVAAALRNYEKYAGRPFDLQAANADTIADVQAAAGRVCPAPPRPAPKAEPAPAALPPAVGQNCFTFNGQKVCD